MEEAWRRFLCVGAEAAGNAAVPVFCPVLPSSALTEGMQSHAQPFAFLYPAYSISLPAPASEFLKLKECFLRIPWFQAPGLSVSLEFFSDVVLPEEIRKCVEKCW